MLGACSLLVANGVIELARRIDTAARRESVVDVDAMLDGGREPRETVVVLDSEAFLVPASFLVDVSLTVFFQLGMRPDGI
jgi:hypothetical protein